GGIGKLTSTDTTERNAGMLLGHPRPAPPLCGSSCLQVLVPRRPGRARRRQRRLGPAPRRRPRWWTRRWGRRGSARRRKPALAVCTFDPLRGGGPSSGPTLPVLAPEGMLVAHDDRFRERHGGRAHASLDPS